MIPRRASQFLTEVIRLYREEGRPVHYTRVASRLGVSKWAAYGRLRRLEAAGYLEAVYEVHPPGLGPAGRSLVTFRPTDRGLQEGCARADGGPALSDAEWHRLSGQLLARLELAHWHGTRRLIRLLRAELSECRPPLPFAARLLTILVLYLRLLGRQAQGQVRSLLLETPRELRVITFAGLVTGGILRPRGRQIALRSLRQPLLRLQEELSRFSPRDRELLSDFLSLCLDLDR